MFIILVIFTLDSTLSKFGKNRFNIPSDDDTFSAFYNSDGIDTSSINNGFNTPCDDNDENDMFFVILAYLNKKKIEKFWEEFIIINPINYRNAFYTNFFS